MWEHTSGRMGCQVYKWHKHSDQQHRGRMKPCIDATSVTVRGCHSAVEFCGQGSKRQV